MQIIGSKIWCPKDPSKIASAESFFKENVIWFNRFPFSRTFLTYLMVTTVNVLIFFLYDFAHNQLGFEATNEGEKEEKKILQRHTSTVKIDSSLSTSLLWDYSPLMVRLVGHVLRRHMLRWRLRHIDLRWMHCVMRVNHFRLLCVNPF